VTILDEFIASIPSLGKKECWPWPGAKNAKGYGIRPFKVNGRQTSTTAHRVVWERVVGPIAVGLQLDHLCRNRECCNPSHLEPVTPLENSLRGDTVMAHNTRKTACSNGHALEGDNLHLSPEGWRVCRTCKARKAVSA